MESVQLQAVRKIAEAYDKSLKAGDQRFRREVSIIHEDGSITNYDSAFLMQYEDWLICFTEHHGIHINHVDDLLVYWESERRRKPVEKMPNLT